MITCFYNTESGEIVAYMDHETAALNPIGGCSSMSCSSQYSPQDYKIVNGGFVKKVKPPIDPLINIRIIRNSILKECDWTQVLDVALSPEKKVEWATYRQLLRDFPETCDPLNPIWPTQPS